MNRRNLISVVVGTVVLGIVLGVVGSRSLFTPAARAGQEGIITSVPGPIDTRILEQATTIPNHPMVTMVTVELPPGASSAPHRHPGPAFGYVIEGELLFQIEGSAPVMYKQGQAFYEPPGVVHLVTRNPSTKQRTRFLAVVIGQQGQPVELPICGPGTESTNRR